MAFGLKNYDMKLSIELKDLVGIHFLSGVDVGTDTGNGASISFKLDDLVYVVTEDPEDGYRSSMKEVSLAKDKAKILKNKFPAIKVDCKMSESSGQEILLIKNYESEKVIIEIGTDNIDDYYPCFVSSFNPENITNSGMGKLRNMVRSSVKKYGKTKNITN